MVLLLLGDVFVTNRLSLGVGLPYKTAQCAMISGGSIYDEWAHRLELSSL